jgi:energy-coupling factor transporter ATP-binding protein EcfA2
LDEGASQPADAASVQVGEVYRDLLAWSSTLPLWQQELLRRVLRATSLSAEDIKELATVAVSETEQQKSSFAPLSLADVPSIAVVEERRILVGMRNLRNVNALRSDQLLTFGGQLTVVYGDNASGKSGYGRVLKKVYRARVVEEILSDVRADSPSAEAPCATFVVRISNGSDASIEWNEGKPVTGVARFSVLDSACSATYVRGGTLGIGPAGIDVPGRFAEDLDRIKKEVATRAAAALPSKKTLERLETKTDAGRFVRGLSSATSDSSIESACKWTADDDARSEQLAKEISAAKAISPSARRVQLQSRLSALESIGKRLAGWTTAVTQVDALNGAVTALAEAEAAVRAVQSLGDSSAPSDALNSRIWIDLMNAANTYVASIDQHKHTPGTMAVDGRCALCWQELDAPAKARLQRFKDHLDGSAVKTRANAKKVLDEIVAKIRAVPDEITPEDTAVLSDDSDLHERVRNVVAVLRTRRDTLLKAVQVSGSPDLPEVDPGALTTIRSLYAQTREAMKKLPQKDEDADKHVQQLEDELLELTSRRQLSDAVTDVRDFVSKMRERQRLKSAEGAINTRAASTKAGELHAKHVTDRYRKLVDEELGELGFRRRKPLLAARTNKARVEMTPFVSPEMRHIPAERVFSEGERTAIALACFLSELRLGDDPSGLIFDDPVSSLDHGVREYVARRLVRAAKDRQVIVFTHDLAFFADLCEQAEKIQHVDAQFRTLVATDHATGIVQGEEPFGARSVSKRIKYLEHVVKEADKASASGDVPILRARAAEFYEHLRATWERFVEERMFGKAVMRLTRNVSPGALKDVVHSPGLVEKVQEGYRRCSNAIPGHDHAPAAGEKSASVEEMKADLKTLLDAEQMAVELAKAKK